MAFIEKKDPVVLNIKLTSCGRQLLSTGNLTFNYFAIGDSEIDYKFVDAVHASDVDYTSFDSIILRPADNNPNIISFIPRNLSGDSYNVIPGIPAAWYPVVNSIEPIGFFTNNGTTFINDSNHVKQPDAMVYMSGITGGTTLRLYKAPTYGTSGNEPAVGDLVLVKWTLNANTTGYTVNASAPTPYLIYQIVTITPNTSLAANNLVLTVDRNLPDFTGHATTSKAGAMILYNQLNYSGSTILNNLSTEYLDESVIAFLENSECPTVVYPFWNMSIIFTEEIAGVKSGDTKYTKFNSRGYGGFVSYIQSQAPFYKKLGVIHYTNQSPANVYAEGFYSITPNLIIPTIMWHKSSGTTMGVRLKAGIGYTLVDLGIHYYDLIDDSGNIVGKIFDELKMFLIEDQELLYAMSYKSNRSWTLPIYELNVGGGCVAPPEPPAVLFVQTQLGSPGSINGTGGINIIGFDKLTEYGVEYKLASDPDIPASWKAIRRYGALTVNNFSIDINDTLPDTSYNYRSYVKMNNNSYVDTTTVYTITTLPAPVVVIPPPVIVPSVQTTDGTAGIGRIDGTGGYDIQTNVSIAIEYYGVEYSGVTSAWTQAMRIKGPILGIGSFIVNITGLVNTQPTPYNYRAYIEVAGVPYYGPIKSITVLAQPVVTTYVPQVVTTTILKQATDVDTITVLVKDNTITDKGGLPITRYGVLYTEWSTFSSPSTLIYGNVGAEVKMVYFDGDPTSLVFSTSILGLADSSPFWYRAFAMNSVGIGYGSIEQATTIPLAVTPPSKTVYIGTATQTGTVPSTTSTLSAKIAVSSPLLAGQSIILHVTTCGLSDTITSPNQALLSSIRTCAYYTEGSSTVKNILAMTDVNYGTEATCANENYGTITITSTNIDTICLRANAYSSSKNTSYSYTNIAKVIITSIENVGGANYGLGTNTLTANNSGTGSGSWSNIV